MDMPSTLKCFQGQTEILLWQQPSFSRAKESIHSWGLRIWGNPSPPALITAPPDLLHCTKDFLLLRPPHILTKTLWWNYILIFSIKETHSERLCSWPKVTELGLELEHQEWRVYSLTHYIILNIFNMTAGDLLRRASSADKNKRFIMCMEAYVMPSLKSHFPSLSHPVTTGGT